jgi:hypothetical protein
LIKINTKVIKNIKKKIDKIHENQKFSILKNVKKKGGQTQKKKKFQSDIQITIFLHSLGCNLSDCMLNLFGKILEQEIFQVKVRTLTFCVGWTRSGSESNWAIKPEPYTQKGCLKVQITLF